jgi:hypothetical protein
MGSARHLGRKVTVGLSSLVLAATGIAYLSIATPSTVGAAIAGSRTLLDVEGHSVVTDDPSCGWVGDNCRSYPVRLTAGTYLQVQLLSTVGYTRVELRNTVDEMGYTSTTSEEGFSSFFEFEVEDTGDYVLWAGSYEETTYDLYAFETPTTLANVPLPTTIKDEFDGRTTRRSSSKDGGYFDAVTFNGTQGQRVTVTFTKPGEDNAQVFLSDTDGNDIATAEGDQTATLTQGLTTSGRHTVTIQGTTQGAYTLTLVDPDAPIVKPAPAKVAVKSVSLSKKKVKVRKGKKVTLRATVLPANATQKAVRWKSSKPKVASVKKGVVKGKRKGKAVITVTTVDGGKKAKVTVKVRKARKR